jgi:transcriptional regulator with XRE-family HTH domain
LSDIFRQTLAQMICSPCQVSGKQWMRALRNRPIISDMRQYDNNIAKLRQARGLSLEALAELVNSNRQTVHDVEIGRTGLTLAWMRRLAPALGCAPADLLLDDDKPYALSPEEIAYIEAIRALPSGRAGMVPAMISALAS